MAYDDDGAGSGGGGDEASGAAALVGGDQGAGGGDDAAAGDAGGGGSGGGGSGDGGDDPAWLEQFSAEAGDGEAPSNRDWVKSLGVKDLDALAKIARDNQKAARAKGIQVPGESAKPEEVAAFHKAIGVPDNADGYAISLPEGVAEDELDMDLIGSLKGKALEAGIPAKGFDQLVQSVIQGQLDAIAAERSDENRDRDALLAEWGAQKDAFLADVNNATRALGLGRADVLAMQRGFRLQYGEPGTRRTLTLLQKLGAGLAEDTLLHGDGPRRFGVTGAEAQAEIDKLISDRTFQADLAAGKPEAKARWSRLNAAVAAEIDRKRAQGA